MTNNSVSDGTIYFFFEKSTTLRHRTALKSFLLSIFEKEGKQVDSVNFIFCSDKRILEINRQYLKHDYYTDIISFELTPKGVPVSGEIYISIDRVKDNAKQLGHSFTQELHRVIFHGILHFCGYKDKSSAEAKKMRLKEDEYLSLYGLTR